MFTLAQLANARRIAEGSLPDLAVIERPEKMSDAAGGKRSIWSVVSRDVRFRVYRPQKAREGVQGGGVRSSAEWAGECPVGTDLQTKDRVVVNGARWEVLGTNAGESEAFLLVADLARAE